MMQFSRADLHSVLEPRLLGKDLDENMVRCRQVSRNAKQVYIFPSGQV